jgi:hypothetical protein
VRTAIARNSPALFTVSTLTLIAASALIMHSALFRAAPHVAAWGVTFDLAISIPLLYWFLIVRSGKAPAVTIVPVCIVGILLATALVPRAQQQFLGQLKLVVIPAAELLAVVTLVRQGNRVKTILGSELAMFYYAIFGWRKKPAAVQGHAFTLHERSGWGTVVACILVLIAAEGIGMHLLLGIWSKTAAWFWTALDLWAVVWLLGDYQALRLRPSSIDGNALHIRYGVRWNVTVPLASISSVEEVHDESAWKRKDVLKVAILEEPHWLIRFDEPVIAQGLAGFTKEIRAIALLPDDDETISVLQRAIDRRRLCDTRAARP